MRTHARRLTRLGILFQRFFWVVLVVCFIGIAVWYFTPKTFNAPRLTVVIASSPVVVWSCDMASPNCVVVTIPSSYVVQAVHGYGNYSLDALWRLGFIDRRGGTILSESAAEALSISNSWYIGTRDETLPAVSNGVAYGKKVISLSSLPSFTLHRYRSDMPVWAFIQMARRITSAKFDQITAIDLSQKPIIEKQTLPDGTIQNIISPDQTDITLKGIFEDTRIRQEGLTVTVNNTTDTPSLGTRAARFLSAVGVLVVSVGNDSPETSSCVISGNKSSLTTITAQVVESILNCNQQRIVNGQTSDIIVRIGKDFAVRYMP